MKSFKELGVINKIAKQKELRENSSSTLQAGLTVDTGVMNTPNTLQNQKSSVSTSGQNSPSHAVLREDGEGRAKLTKLLEICFDTLDNYGKEPEQLENISRAFQMFLWDYSYESIERAFRFYIKSETTMPKPANIISIIEKQSSNGTDARLSEGQRKSLEELRKKHGLS